MIENPLNFSDYEARWDEEGETAIESAAGPTTVVNHLSDGALPRQGRREKRFKVRWPFSSPPGRGRLWNNVAAEHGPVWGNEIPESARQNSGRPIKANILGAAVIGLAILLGPGFFAHVSAEEPAEAIGSIPDNYRIGTEFDDLISEIAESRRVPYDFLLSAAKRIMLLDVSSYSDEVKIRDALTAVAEGYSENINRTEKQGVSDAEARPLLQQAKAAVNKGRFQDAGYIYAKLADRNVTAVREMEDQIKNLRLSAARNMANMGDIAGFQADYRQAASHYADAYEMGRLVDQKEAAKYLTKQADNLLLLGNEYSDKQILLEVVGIYRKILSELGESSPSRAEDARKGAGLDWADIQTSLAASLHALGKLEQGTARLEEAAEAYRLALAVKTREGAPLAWAAAQRDLGNVLKTLGERESGTARLEEAAGAYRLALAVFARDKTPLDWAMTQSNLGSVLLALGERESGTARLEEAAGAYRLALEAFARGRVPLKWAGTQNNLGNALSVLGKRESAPERLKEAVQAYRLALEVYTKESVPPLWAIAQYNLGNALADLGGLERGAERLKEAVQAYRLALEVYTRESAPLDWAMTQSNLGSALQALGKRERGTERLKEAVEAHSQVLKENTREKDPLKWAYAQNNLGNAFLTLGEREFGSEQLTKAVEAYRLALEVYTKESAPLDWAMIQNNLGVALQTLGRNERGTARLKESVEAFRLALEVRTRERYPQNWASTQNNLGSVLLIWGARESGTERLEEAMQAYRLALEVIKKENNEYLHNMILKNIEKAQTIIKYKETTEPKAAPDAPAAP